MSPNEVAAAVAKISAPPPPGAPFALPVPNSATPNRSAVYRHWRFRDSPLLETLESEVQTLHDAFEMSAKHCPKKQFLGWRPWNVATQTHDEKFVWMTYAEAAERRKNLGAGLVEIHKAAGVTADKYAIGLWCQNRPEWQITGMSSVPFFAPKSIANLQTLLPFPSLFTTCLCTRLLAPMPQNISSTTASLCVLWPRSPTFPLCLNWLLVCLR